VCGMRVPLLEEASQRNNTVDSLGPPTQSAKRPTTYEELVACSPQASIFAHRWWLDAVAPGMYEILEVSQQGQIKAAWPLVRLIKGEGKYVYMPPLTQKLGILFAPTQAKPVEVASTNQNLAGELIEKLGKPVSFHQNFHENFIDWLPFYWRGHSQTTRYTYVLEDISDPNELWVGMRPHHRRIIRRAGRLGIGIRDDLALEQFLELNRKTFSRQGIQPLVSDDIIRRVDEACGANGGRKIFVGVDAPGKVHAAVYIAWVGNTAYYLMGGSEPELRQSGAQVLALWEAICFAGSVVQRFDFEGSMLPQIERVFRGFGATQVPYFSISKFPPAPTTLRGFVKASFNHRWRNLRGEMMRRFQLGSAT
jgi:hypothetical protein